MFWAYIKVCSRHLKTNMTINANMDRFYLNYKSLFSKTYLILTLGAWGFYF